MSDERLTVTLAEAIALLPSTPGVHTFVEAPGMLIGCDIAREDLIAQLAAADEIRITGPAAQSMGHGLAIMREDGPLFIEARNIGKLEIWTVFDRPRDYPNNAIARKFLNDQPTEEFILGETVKEVTAKLPPGLIFIPRMPADNESIVGVWL